ncbi:hypothetical protein HELRODRAFT_185150 [Helobdella robusta]|uniref:BACK domain-containing protein n=1 Tax=Helobdella robusta TaxID=6412 RepID=T1FMG2_HELRO|nr:hypothetical protein HELRODRAFT_185150 [Helobdella robusta]ESN92706.1 hypothetical protein HELRODRAFT_185150 [Helobdella robusta]
MKMVCEIEESKSVDDVEDIVLISKTGGRFIVDAASFYQSSGYYRALKKSGMKDAQCKELKFEYFTDNFLAEVEKYFSKVSSSNVDISDQLMKRLDEVEEELNGAFYLQINGLVDHYVLLVLRYLNIKTWRHILDIAYKYALDSLSHKILDFVAKNFNNLQKHSELLTLTPNEMFYLVKSDLVSASSEIDIFNFVVKWFFYDESRKPHAEKLLSEVRYSLMRTSDEKQCRGVIETLALRVCLTKHEVKFRDTVDVLLAFGKRGQLSPLVTQILPVKELTRACKYRSMFRRMKSQRKNKSIAPLVKFRCNEKKYFQGLYNFGSCVVNNCVYIAGGQYLESEYSAAVYSFNPIRNKWKPLSKMPTQRASFYLGEINGSLYAVAGCRSDDGHRSVATSIVEKYIPEENRWYKLAPLPTAVYDLAGCTYGGDLYVSGGNIIIDGVNRKAKELWMYDPTFEGWLAKAPMLTARGRHVMACFSNKLIAIGGQSIFSNLFDGEIYDCETNQWTCILSLKKPVCSSTYAIVDNCLYLFSTGQNFFQRFNLTKYLKVESDKNESPLLKDVLNQDKNKIFISDNLPKRYSSNIFDDDCKLYKFKASHKILASVSVIRLSKNYLRGFK